MEGAPPPLSFLSKGDVMVEEQPLLLSTEERLASLVASLMLDQLDASRALQQLVVWSHDEASQTRQQLGPQMHSTTKSLLLQSAAGMLEAQAATWDLVHHLCCTECPAALGGPRPCATGTTETARQAIVDQIAQDPDLDRCARVVAWLEGLAEEQLKADPSGGFATGEGLPMATLPRAGTTALDPDAPWREGSRLEAADTRNNERIMQRVWRLIRAGQTEEAVALAHQVGQAWRAAGMLGGGPFGPLPVGAAGELQDEAGNSAQLYEEMAAELEHGRAAPSALWKWSCYRASVRDDVGRQGMQHERAVYGAMCGNLRAMLAACSSWEDAAWAHCRAYLDLSADQLLQSHQEPIPADRSEVKVDEVLEALRRTSGGQQLDEVAVVEAMSLGQRGAWPAPELVEEVSGGLGAVFLEALPHLLHPKQEAHDDYSAKYHRLQEQLILEHHAALVCSELVDALQAEGGPWQVPPPSVPAAASSQQYLLLRFGVHLALMMRALRIDGSVVEAGESPMDADGEEGEEGGAQMVVDFEQVSVATDKLLMLYCGHLMERGMQPLVPQYAVHCSAFSRSSVLLQLLRAATHNSVAAAEGVGEGGLVHDALEEASCLEVWGALEGACQVANSRQDAWREASQELLPKEVERGVLPPDFKHHLQTSIQPDELHQLLQQMVRDCSSSSTQGPLWRARAVRWLFYPYLQQTLALDSPHSDPSAHFAPLQPEHATAVEEALKLACRLACCLDAPMCAAAADLLWQHVVPPEFAGYMAEQLDACAEEARQAGAPEDDPALQHALVAAGQLRGHVVELAALIATFQHLRAARDWQERAVAAAGSGSGGEGEGVDREALQEEGRQLVEEAFGLLESAAPLLQSGGELLASAGQQRPTFLQLRLTLAPQGTGSVHIAEPFPSLQGAAGSQLEEQVAAAAGAWIKEAAGGAAGRGLLAVRVSLHTEGEGAATLLLLELEPKHRVPEAYHQLLSLPVALMRGALVEGLPGPLMLEGMECSPLLDTLLAQRVLAAQLLAEVQQLRLQLLALGAGQDAFADAVVRMAEPDGLLGQVVGLLPREVVQQVCHQEAEVEVAAMRALEAQRLL